MTKEKTAFISDIKTLNLYQLAQYANSMISPVCRVAVIGAAHCSERKGSMNWMNLLLAVTLAAKATGV